jgi:hypothetical protein
MAWSKRVVGAFRNKGDAWDTLYKSIRVPKDESEDTPEHSDLREKMERILKEVEDTNYIRDKRAGKGVEDVS